MGLVNYFKDSFKATSDLVGKTVKLAADNSIIGQAGRTVNKLVEGKNIYETGQEMWNENLKNTTDFFESAANSAYSNSGIKLVKDVLY